ncbi:MAG: Ig-like domain-containing protein [Muribaculaceae bacterium]|nr:Ig-like domain-containing protein [Muribaculaceae bacterium]
MRKFLLSLASAVLAVSGAMAAEANFTFTGNGSVYGMPRSTGNNPAALEDPCKISDQGVEITFTAGGNGGWSLAFNKMVTNSGMQILASGSNHAMTISAPGGIISKVEVTLSNAWMEITVDGKSEQTSTFIWEGAKNSVEFLFGEPEVTTYIKTINVTYSEGSSDLKEAGLSFSSTNVSAVYGEPFTAPEFLNPNNLPVTWSSTKPAVATVDETGAVTLVGGGITTITAFTEGNDEYASGMASYVLSVTPLATSAAQLISLAPAAADVVKIDFPITVTYANQNNELIWGIDPEGNALAIKTSFEVGEYQTGSVIPAGWFATNNTISGNVTWTGTLPAAEASTVEVTYPEVPVVSVADAARVVWLKSVVFEESTPKSGQSVDLKVLDMPVVIMNYLGAPVQPAGAYDILGAVVVRTIGGKETVYFYPIEYKEGEAPKPMVEKNSSLDFAKALGATLNTVTKLETPRDIISEPITVTLTEAPQAYYYSTKGLQIRPTNSSEEGTSKFTIATDGRQIKKIEFVSGWIDPLTVNGTILPDGKYNSSLQDYVYTWEAPATFTADNVEVAATVNGNTFMRSITVYYMEEGSGLIIPNLTVDKEEITVSFAEKTLDLASNIKNPNEAPIIWSLSNDGIGSIEGSTLTFKESGVVTVTATVDDPAYDPETKSYTLNIEYAAFTAPQLIILAPEEGDKVEVNDKLGFIVAAATTGSYYDEATESNLYEAYIFVEDNDGNPAVLCKNGLSLNISGFEKNKVIPGGWIATNISSPDMTVWKTSAGVNGSAYGWFESFQDVETLEGVTEYKVVNLKNATLPGVPTEKGLIIGKLSNNSEVAVISLVNRITALKRGIYDMTGIMVKNGNGEPVFYPASFTLVEELPEELPSDFPTKIEITTDGDAVTVNQYFDDEDGQILVTITGATNKDKLTVSFTTPEGWDGFYANKLDEIGVPGPLRVPVEADGWAPVDIMSSMNFTQSDSLTFDLNKEATPFGGALYLYKGDQVYTGMYVYLMGKVAYDDPTGIAEIEDIEAGAKYFNLQGIEVKNPTPGVYVKVAEGKTSKVILK